MLPLIFPTAILVRGFAFFVGLEKDHLSDALVRIYLGGKRCSVREFERHMTLPFRLEWRDIDDDSTSSIRALSKTDGQDVPGNAKVFDCASECETIWRNNHRTAFDINKVVRVKVFRINNRAVQI